jgi:hypothetical protein
MRSWRQALRRTAQVEARDPGTRWWRGELSFRTLLVYGLPLIAITALHLLLFPPIRTAPSLKLEVGDITEHEVRAPFPFSAPRPRRELEAARLEASRRVEPVYLRETEAEKHSKEEVARFLTRAKFLAASDSLSLAKKVTVLQSEFRGIGAQYLRWLVSGGTTTKSNAIRSLADRLLDRGIVDTTPRGNYSLVHVIDPDSLEDRVEEVDDLVLGYRQGEAARKEAGAFFRRADEKAAVAAILAYLLTPNLSYDDARTEEQRSLAVAEVPTNREFARNERILDSGVRVNREDLAVLTALEEARRERAFASNKGVALRLRAGRAILVLSLLLGLCLSLSGRHKKQLSDYRRFLALCVLLILYLLFTWLALSRGAFGPIAVPIVMLVMLATILHGEGPAARMLMASVLLIALLPSIQASTLLVWIVAGAIAMRMVRRVRNRNQFYKAIGVVSIGYLISVGALQLGQANSLEDWVRPVLWGIGSGIVSTALALFLLPVFESIFEITTDLTLLELSDLNHPLLRRMALESPGTFHHSQVVGTLAEAASRAINANSLRTRVGANYHDIGKLLKPRYYVENQKGGPNAHDDLSPRMSALVIAAHVKDGVELGRQWGLPKDVTDFIPEHHGTSVMRYFYHKALERDDGGAVKVEDFRYPGPKPQSKETAIVMLADGVEASTRSLRRPTPSRIREMVKGILERRMEEGELDDCSLTMRDLARVREAFVPILVGIHHQRVAYPGQKEHEDKKEKESIETRARGRRGQDSVASRR